MFRLAAIFAGIILGIFTGLLPGIHSNTVASVLATTGVPAEYFALLVAAVLGAHGVFQFFPSVFLSIPDDTVVASVLPGHRMALEGRGREAIATCAFSAVLSAGASALLLPLSLLLLPAIYSAVAPHMALILILASLFLLASERKAEKILLALFVFLLSGLLGVATLRGAINDALFPAFSGLFAASGILLSFASRQALPSQRSGETRLDFLPYVALGVLFGMLSDLLPGIAAPAQIAVFASAVLAADEAKKFLALVASIASSHTVFAFAALLSIGKAREGSIAIMDGVRPVLPSELPVLLGSLFLSIGVASFLLIKLARHADLLHNIETRKLNLAVLAYLTFAVAAISGAAGLLTFATAAAIGILPPMLGIRRTHVMGLIIIPSILLAL